MNRLPLFLLISLWIGCIPPAKDLRVYNECEKAPDSSATRVVKVLQKGFLLEDLATMPLSDSETIIRIYEEPALSTESLIQIIEKDGEMKIERRTVDGLISMDLMAQYHARGGGTSTYPHNPDRYEPTVGLHIQRTIGEEDAHAIKRFIEQWDPFTIKNITQCYDNGEEIRILDGVTYFLEIKKGARYHFVAFRGGNYRYQAYRSVMKLFGDVWSQ